MQTVAFGRFICQRASNFSQTSLHLLDATVTTSFLSTSQVPLNTNELLDGLQGVLCVMDDILAFGQAKSNMSPDLTQYWIAFPHQASLLTLKSARDY